MSTIHLLNTSPGDCTIIQHNSGRVTMIDICDGNIKESLLEALSKGLPGGGGKGNFAMCQYPTNPVTYAKGLGMSSIFRFVLTHPDMDHMDGFAKLLTDLSIGNFWDTGARKPKPDFSGSPYDESDWDAYVRARDGKHSGCSTALRRAGDRFAFANKGEEQTPDDHDGLYILAPDANLINDPDICDDVNEGSYVLLYRSAGGRIILPGDAHDASWAYVRANYASDVANCSFLLAPHHGRDSDRSYDFLDLLKPKLTLIGCAPSQHIDYDQWNRRNLPTITSNQCGNVVLDSTSINNKPYIQVYIENDTFAESKGCNLNIRNAQGYVLLYQIPG